jgi:transcriptional regulator
MKKAEPYSNRIDLLQGTLDMLILQTLQWGPMHGYGIAQAIHIKSTEALKVETGSLYPALHRLERQKWVKSEWDLTDSKQRAKFYRITPKGKEQLSSELGRWRHMVRAIGAVLETGKESS